MSAWSDYQCGAITYDEYRLYFRMHEEDHDDEEPEEGDDE